MLLVFKSAEFFVFHSSLAVATSMGSQHDLKMSAPAEILAASPAEILAA